jgi:hypothetical protein
MFSVAPFFGGFLLRCGSIAANSTIVWKKGGQYGVSFRLPLSEEQMTEQLSRSEALQEDWDGYCRATRKVLAGVRELIAAEKKTAWSGAARSRRSRKQP